MAETPPIELDRNGDRPIYAQLAESLQRLILDGYVRANERLPTIRQLAADLGIARSTVVTAYEQLAVEGYLVARVGSGTRVAPELPDPTIRAAATPGIRPRNAPSPLPPIDTSLPSTTYHSARSSWGSLPFDFRPGRPDVDLFPVAAWERLLRDAWRDLVATRGAAVGYADPAGNPRLRRALADHLSLARAVRCRQEQIVVTAGAQSAFATAVRLWLAPGRIAVVEDPGYPMAWRAITASGAQVVTRRVDVHGLTVDRLPDEATLVLVTPSWQFPCGGTMPISRRLALLDWARQVGAVVIEDDYDSELRYTGRPLASLQGIDNGGRVLYVGTFSKIGFPGLRLGYAVVPEQAIAPFTSAVEITIRSVPALEQLAMARFIESGLLERHLRRVRTFYAERQAVLVETLMNETGRWLVAQPAPAGMHLIAALAPDVSFTAMDIVRAARSVGVNIVPLTAFRLAPADDREIIMGYPALQPAEIREGVRRLAAVLSHLSGNRLAPASAGTRRPSVAIR
jgi:GntR family transcriptional regulator/MocR family aminotransferase